MKTRFTFLAAALTVAALPATTTAVTPADRPSDLRKAREATADYRHLATAEADGYALLTDAQGIACIDNPGVGAMGVHYVKEDLVGDAAVDPSAPEALVYEQRRRGRMRLVALEYVVFQEQWDAEHDSPPELFGREFMLVLAPNRYGLPAFYELHVWLWKHNPRGLFDDWNPRVSCEQGCRRAARPVAAGERPSPGGPGRAEASL